MLLNTSQCKFLPKEFLNKGNITFSIKKDVQFFVIESELIDRV